MHQFDEEKQDVRSGLTFKKCVNCGAVCVEGDDLFNMYCSYDEKSRNIERIKMENK